jgi:protocatechuate 3,4-dioxygenase beta subunit
MICSVCSPLANAAVDIWHCDAQGYDSGISGENPGGGGDQTTDENLTTTFLRGIQLTGEDGFVEFDTIYPGWYVSRTVHIHMKVVVDGTAGETYDGGTVAHTEQLFFEDEISDQVFSTHEDYSGRDEADRTVNEGDNILGDHEDDPGFIVAITGSVNEGYTGTIWIGVDPEATPDAGGGGGQGGPPQGGDRPPGGGDDGPGSPPAGDQ